MADHTLRQGPPFAPQHVLSVFRTQRVAKVLFDLSTADCRATMTLHCENGGHEGQGSSARLPGCSSSAPAAHDLRRLPCLCRLALNLLLPLRRELRALQAW